MRAWSEKEKTRSQPSKCHHRENDTEIRRKTDNISEHVHYFWTKKFIIGNNQCLFDGMLKWRAAHTHEILWNKYVPFLCQFNNCIGSYQLANIQHFRQIGAHDCDFCKKNEQSAKKQYYRCYKFFIHIEMQSHWSR